MKTFLRKAAGLLLMAVSGPFLIQGGLSRYSYQGILKDPNYWMLLPAGILLLAGLIVFAPRKR
jgi:hypothetical protein